MSGVDKCNVMNIFTEKLLSNHGYESNSSAVWKLQKLSPLCNVEKQDILLSHFFTKFRESNVFHEKNLGKREFLVFLHCVDY